MKNLIDMTETSAIEKANELIQAASTVITGKTDDANASILIKEVALLIAKNCRDCYSVQASAEIYINRMWWEKVIRVISSKPTN